MNLTVKLYYNSSFLPKMGITSNKKYGKELLENKEK